MQKNKVFLIQIAVLFLISAAGLTAQSMDVVDDLIAAEKAGFGNSVYMIAVGSGLSDEDSSVSDVVQIINDKNWNKKQKQVDDPITLGELSFITMKAFDIDGGIMYMLLPSGRYAVRELEYLGMINGEAHPNKLISGADVVNLVSEVVAMQEAE